jgi:hypothetical protein
MKIITKGTKYHDRTQNAPIDKIDSKKREKGINKALCTYPNRHDLFSKPFSVQCPFSALRRTQIRGSKKKAREMTLIGKKQ